MAPKSTDEAKEDQLLGAMMSYNMRGIETVSFAQLAKDLDFMERTKSWRNAWKHLAEDTGFIESAEGATSTSYTGGYRVTAEGKKHGSTPEYEEYLKELNFVPASNEQHQEHIKKRLLNKYAVKIFELLLKYGSLTRMELAMLIGCNDRMHNFSYGLQDLVKVKNLVEQDSAGTNKSKLRLSDKAFLKPEDRPDPEDIDEAMLEEGKKKIEAKKHAAKSTETNKKKEAKASKKAHNSEKKRKAINTESDVEGDPTENIKEEEEEEDSKKAAEEDKEAPAGKKGKKKARVSLSP